MKKYSSRIFFIVFFLVLLVPCSFGQNSLKEFFESATAAYAHGEYKKAVDLYNQCLEIYAKFPQAYNFRGLARKANGTDLKEVADDFLKAIELDPSYADPYHNLAKVYYEMGMFDEAKEYGVKAVELKPDFTKAHLTLGWVYLLGQSQPDLAAEQFEYVVNHARIPYAFFGLGMAYFMDGERIKVLEMITALRSMDQEDLAKKLEAMVRNNQYLPPDNLGPLIKAKREMEGQEEMDQTFFKDEDHFLPPQNNVKVRLKGKIILPETTHKDQIESLPMTGAERIEELKRRGRSY